MPFLVRILKWRMKGLWNVEWSQQPRLSPWAGPPQRPTHSFHSSGWGWNIKPPAWDRRSLLTGSSRGGPSRRDIISGNHTLHGHRGAMRSSRTRSRWTLSRTPRSRAIGVKAYRRSLGHVCTIGSSLGGAGCMRENQSGQWDVSRDANRSTYAWLPPNQLHHLGVEPPFPGPQPLSRQDVCSYTVDPRDVSCSKKQQLPLGLQEDLVCQFAKWTWPQTPWWFM